MVGKGGKTTKALGSADDLAEYNMMKNLLGSNAPVSFDDFKYLKYNSNEWIDFKNYSKAIENGELSAIVDYNTYKNVGAEIDKIVGVTAKGGLEITQKSNHFVNRTIGSIYQRRSGVSLNQIKEALLNPTEIIKSENSWKYYLEGVCSVTVNPKTGKLIQTNPEHSLKVTK